MNLELKILDNKIDFLRNKLYGLISFRNLTDKSIVFYSQQLDLLLNEYEKMEIKLLKNHKHI